MDLDRELIAAVVEHELFMNEDLRGNWSALERTSRVSHSTMSRLKRADENVSTASFRRIEAALALPFDLLATIGLHDMDGVRELGASDRLVKWITPKMLDASSG